MLKISRFINDYFSSCAYVVTHESLSEALVIDPSDIVSHRISAYLKAERLIPSTIILTHEHFDHITGVVYLKECYGAKIICSRICSENIVSPSGNFSRYAIKPNFACEPADYFCEDVGYHVNWYGVDVEFIPTPGHSPGSICINLGGVLFSGDTIIHDHETITKLPGGSIHTLQQSVDLILARFPGETLVYPGHGESFLLKEVNRNGIIGN